jgi:ADP-ribose pyrophosphatase
VNVLSGKNTREYSDDALIEFPVKENTVFKGKIISVNVDEVILAGGREAIREVVVHPGAVGIIVIDEEGRIGLVRQFRYPTREVLWEIPAGKIDSGEDPFGSAKRELLEEVGVRAEKWERVIEFYSSPGIMTESLTLFRASRLSQPCEAVPVGDEDERIIVRWTPVGECLDMVRRGEIKDAKTLVAVFLEGGSLGCLRAPR